MRILKSENQNSDLKSNEINIESDLSRDMLKCEMVERLEREKQKHRPGIGKDVSKNESKRRKKERTLS